MNKKQKEIYHWLMSKPGYLKKSVASIKSTNKSWNISDIKIALAKAKEDFKNGVKVINKTKLIKDKLAKSTKKIVIEAVASKPLNSIEAEKLIGSLESKRSLNQRKIKRLFFDIETSPNLMYSWRSGYNLNLGPEMIVRERAVICLCYKWENSSKVHSLTWNNGDDKQVLLDFMDIIESADEVVGHNSDKFDIKWLRTRCFYHKIRMPSKVKSIDTFKWAKEYFNFNSNKLDYIGQFSGVGKKMDNGGLETFKAIIEDNNPKAMDKMVKYCKVDVIRLSQVFERMFPYCEPKTHLGVLLGKTRDTCPSCASANTRKNGISVAATGVISQKYQCTACGKNFKLPKTIADKLKK